MVKAGIKTSEFWVVLVTQILLLLVATGVLKSEKVDEVAPVVQLVGEILVGVVAGLGAVGYAISRAVVKGHEIDAEAVKEIEIGR